MICLSGKFGSNALSSSSNYRGDTGCWLVVGRRRIAAMLLLDSIDTEPGPMFCRARRRAASGLQTSGAIAVELKMSLREDHCQQPIG